MEMEIRANKLQEREQTHTRTHTHTHTHTQNNIQGRRNPSSQRLGEDSRRARRRNACIDVVALHGGSVVRVARGALAHTRVCRRPVVQGTVAADSVDFHAWSKLARVNHTAWCGGAETRHAGWALARVPGGRCDRIDADLHESINRT